MVRAQLRKGLESARAVMDAWLAGLWGAGERGRLLRRRNWLVKGSISLVFFGRPSAFAGSSALPDAFVSEATVAGLAWVRAFGAGAVPKGAASLGGDGEI